MTTSITLTVKCVFCSKTKDLNPPPPEQPFCECGGPMLAESASTNVHL